MTPDQWFEEHGYDYETTRQLVRDAWNAALEDAAQEADRFLDGLRGRVDERGDGAFVAITRLAKSIRARKRSDAALGITQSTKE